jgi:hypothetical protein
MDRISTSTKALDLFGTGKHGFKDGNLGAGVLPTDFNATWCNDFQEEMLTIIESAGLTPTAGVRTQVYQAIQQMIATATADFKTSVRFSTTANITLSGLGTQAGGDWAGALTAGDRILPKNQSTASQNGIYVAAAGAWVRATDADGAGEITAGMLVTVEEGATLADSLWELTTDNPITIGTTGLAFKKAGGGLALLGVQTFYASGTYTPTAGTTHVLVEGMGGGGGGGTGGVGANLSYTGAGGGGGAQAEMTRAVLQVSTAQTVTIGAGGAPSTNGGNTTLGALFTATGGLKGNNASGLTAGIGGVASNASDLLLSTSGVTGVAGYATGSVNPGMSGGAGAGVIPAPGGIGAGAGNGAAGANSVGRGGGAGGGAGTYSGGGAYSGGAGGTGGGGMLRIYEYGSA